jgi:hypothetical protein
MYDKCVHRNGYVCIVDVVYEGNGGVGGVWCTVVMTSVSSPHAFSYPRKGKKCAENKIKMSGQWVKRRCNA